MFSLPLFVAIALVVAASLATICCAASYLSIPSAVGAPSVSEITQPLWVYQHVYGTDDQIRDDVDRVGDLMLLESEGLSPSWPSPEIDAINARRRDADTFGTFSNAEHLCFGCGGCACCSALYTLDFAGFPNIARARKALDLEHQAMVPEIIEGADGTERIQYLDVWHPEYWLVMQHDHGYDLGVEVIDGIRLRAAY